MLTNQTNRSVAVIILCIILGFVTVFNSCAKKGENVVKIGAILPLTGPLSAIGVPERNMLDLAINHLNKNQTKYRYLFVVEDSKGKPNDGVTVANKLVNIDKIDILFVSLTSVAKAIIPIAEKEMIPVIANSMSTDLPSLGSNVFRFFPSTRNETDMWIEEIKNQNYQSIGYFYINTDYAIEEKQLLENGLSQLSKTLFAESFELQDKDFKTQLLKFKGDGIDVLIISGLGSNYTTIIKQAKEIGLKCAFLGDFDFGLALARNEALKTPEGLAFYNGVVFAMINIEDKSEKLQIISEEYKGKYSDDILSESEAIYFYDAMTLINDILNRQNAFDKKLLIQEMSNTDVLTGLSGKFAIKNRSADIPLKRAFFKMGQIHLGSENAHGTVSQ